MSKPFLPMHLRLKSARVEAQLSQTELSRLSGIAQANISKIEKNVINPTSETCDRWIAAVTEHLGHPPVTLDAIDGVIGIVGRTAGKLMTVDPMATPRPKDWLAQDFVARRFVTVIAGQEGAGKSRVTQTLVAALARGDSEAMGMRLPGKPLRSLVIDAENIIVVDDEYDASIAQERLQQCGVDESNAHLVTLTGAQGFDLDTDGDALEAAVADLKATGGLDLLVLDTLMSLCSVNENNNDGMHRVLMRLNRIAMKHDIGILLIHHTTKQGDRYSGSKAIGSTVAAVYTFSRVIYKDPETGKKAQHPTLRFLHPYKVRLTSEPATRMLKHADNGLVDPKSGADVAELGDWIPEEDDIEAGEEG